MGIDTTAKLIYGFQIGELEDGDLREQIIEAVNYDELAYASPYYDADVDDWIVGISVSTFCTPEVLAQRLGTIQESIKEIDLLSEVEKSGIILRVYCTPDVT